MYIPYNYRIHLYIPYKCRPYIYSSRFGEHIYIFFFNIDIYFIYFYIYIKGEREPHKFLKYISNTTMLLKF